MQNIMWKIIAVLICSTPLIIGIGILIGLIGGNLSYKKENKIKEELMKKFVDVYGFNKLNTVLQYCKETGTDMIMLMQSMINTKNE